MRGAINGAQGETRTPTSLRIPAAGVLRGRFFVLRTKPHPLRDLLMSLQVLVSVRMWEFESPPGHHFSTPP